jgi:hypothetical protein
VSRRTSADPVPTAGWRTPSSGSGTSRFDTAAVVDPFGNVLGIMRNPHYLEVLGRTAQG